MQKVSRRDLLKAAAIAGAGLSRPGSAEPRLPEPATSELITTLSTYMSQAATRQLPNEVVEKTKHVILDTLAAMISGSELPPGKFAIQFARAYKGDRVA